MTGAPHILSRKLWRNHFRGLIKAQQQRTLSSDLAWRKAETVISKMSARSTVAASQHALLGMIGDFFSRKNPLPYAEARLIQLSSLFSSAPITYHLTIQSQLDYLALSLNQTLEDNTFLELRFVPSWAQLVHRIKSTDPGSNIIVWDFEQSVTMEFAFLEALLGVKDCDQKRLLRDFLDTRMVHPEPPVNDGSLRRLSKQTSKLLEAQYQRDLEEIDRMTDVSLIGPKDISD